MRIAGWIGGAVLAEAACAQEVSPFTDSLSAVRSDSLVLADSAATVLDSLHRSGTAAQTWLLPLGIMAATIAAIWLLFSIRSR
jgi:hypothetical protein